MVPVGHVEFERIGGEMVFLIDLSPEGIKKRLEEIEGKKTQEEVKES